MPVQVGNSYVSEAALNYAQAQVTDSTKSGGKKGNSVLSDLSRQFKDVNFSVGTAPFNGKGNNNISISPNVLRQMADDPEKRIEYEALIYDCNRHLKNTANRPNLKAQGYIIGNDGGLRMWSISGSDNGNKKRVLMNMTEEEFKQRLAGRLPDKELAKRQKIAESLKAANDYLNSRKGEIGFQGGSVSVDKDGNISITSAKATVTFNESKRAAQLAAVKTSDDLDKLMSLLQEDLKECEAGLQSNMCDEAEVEKVKKMIERAQQRANELPKNTDQFTSSMIDIVI